MENFDKDIILNNIYELYGPLVGTACKNSNFLLSETGSNHDLNIEKITNLTNTPNLEINNNILGGEIKLDQLNNYKGFNIFGYKISLWMLILFIIILLSLIYYIYKYIFNNDNLVSYEKINIDGNDDLSESESDSEYKSESENNNSKVSNDDKNSSESE